jgi:hypothetical protein
MRLERPKRRLLMLALLGVVLTLLLAAADVETIALRPPSNTGIPRSVIAFGGPDQAAIPVKPRVIICMLKRFLDAPEAPERPNDEFHRAL